ncbi:MAG TPA: hypothetical protein VMH00_06260 [Candidatus Limnocylindrales bacterium]|nr:hypothetical protein [Candidatus Limnocylindrales bacterium]
MKKTTTSKATKSLRRGKKLAKQVTLKPVASAAASTNTPTESVSLNFTKIEW